VTPLQFASKPAFQEASCLPNISEDAHPCIYLRRINFEGPIANFHGNIFLIPNSGLRATQETYQIASNFSMNDLPNDNF
jgi:hypothetical protein